MPSLDATVDEKAPFVKRDLCDRRLDLEARIPGATLCAMKPPTKRARMSEGGVHDVGLRHSQKQLARTNRAVAAILRNLPLVGRGIEFAQISENIRRKGKAFKDTLSTVLRWDQSVGSGLVELYKSCQSVPASLRVDQAPHLLQPRYSRPHHVIDRRLAAEERIIIRLRDPAVR